MQSPKSTSHIGTLIREWRTTRGKSQLATSIEAGISTRHLSFIETGRSMPSREMVLLLAETLDVPLRERNVLLEAAGFAAAFRETPLHAPSMTEVRSALEHILRATEPNPALVVNRRYDILMVNGAAQRLIVDFAPEWDGRLNVVSMLLSRRGLRHSVANWGEVASHVVRRTRAELASVRTRSEEDHAILAEIEAAEAELRHASEGRTLPPSILVPLRLRRGGVSLDLFTTITTLGTPLDITLQEMRIEQLFPAAGSASRAEWND